MKWHGVIGYCDTIETEPGIWEEVSFEREYYGEIIRNTRQLQSANQVNDNINISNLISVIADPYAYKSFHSMRYVEFMGNKWKVTNVEVQYPRLILTIGGLYNG